jgi:polysaccharide export outer membrane protein
MTTRHLIGLTAALSLCVAAAGCNPPKGAPQASQILKGAGEETADFAVVPITRASLGEIADWPGSDSDVSGVSGWISRSRGPASNLIAPGDRLDLTVWESGDSSLLSVPGQKIVTLPGVTVSPDGTIFLPYADQVYVANMTTDDARIAVQAKLDPIVPSAQVMIAHTPGRKSTVDLVSGVAAPGTYPLPDRDFTVLGLLALGGGIPPSLENPQVRLQRDGKLYGISAERLLKDPRLDTTLRGGDKVYVETDQRYFLALGAAGREAPVTFPHDRVTALEALSLSGGLVDTRADAKGILILRDYPAKAVRSDGTGPSKDRVVFVIDLTSADGLFSAGEFHIHHKDVVVVTESPVTATASVLGVLGAAIGVSRTAQVISNN